MRRNGLLACAAVLAATALYMFYLAVAFLFDAATGDFGQFPRSFPLGIGIFFLGSGALLTCLSVWVWRDANQ